MTRPLVAVAGRRIRAGRVAGWRDGAYAGPAQYLEALERAGARGALLPPAPLEPGEAPDLLGRFDALLFMGGGDVDPARYGEEPHPEVGGVDRGRDAFELALAEAAVESGMPFLAICRGMQVLNVALGGSLVQHIEPGGRVVHRGTDTPEAMHAVRVEDGSRLAEAMGVSIADCPASHHQAVARLGRGLRPVASSEDDLIEAVEHERGWTVGVQWHPERSAERDPAQQRLFEALVERARVGIG